MPPTFKISAILPIICLFFVFSANFTMLAQTPKNAALYHNNWIDLNKNGKKDIYEDAIATYKYSGKRLDQSNEFK